MYATSVWPKGQELSKKAVVIDGEATNELVVIDVVAGEVVDVAIIIPLEEKEEGGGSGTAEQNYYQLSRPSSLMHKTRDRLTVESTQCDCRAHSIEIRADPSRL